MNMYLVRKHRLCNVDSYAIDLNSRNDPTMVSHGPIQSHT